MLNYTAISASNLNSKKNWSQILDLRSFGLIRVFVREVYLSYHGCECFWHVEMEDAMQEIQNFDGMMLGFWKIRVSGGFLQYIWASTLSRVLQYFPRVDNLPPSRLNIEVHSLSFCTRHIFHIITKHF